MTIAVNRNLGNCENSPKKSSFCVSFLSFHSFHGLMNSINWPASSVWVFIAQLGEHCSANAEATGSNPVEAPKNFFSGYFRNCLNCDSLRWSHTHFICIPAVHIISFCIIISLYPPTDIISVIFPRLLSPLLITANFSSVRMDNGDLKS